MGAYILHSHALFWFVGIVVFFLTVIFINNGKAKASKILQMVLRLMYVLLLVTGIWLIVLNGFYWSAVVKGLLAIWLIFVMEFISNRMAKGSLSGKGKAIFWIQFIVAFVLVLYFGYVVTG
ncbi:YisL family protein [Evansella cellulosilytica]|uniref:Uncharacterized protein n=1 Tax=Evansella cellulosilytica (strain ATCC 21833 / DSM 2522 / FERM P-1141 / JCM 9156 / N-4) TaxID=649639 RepID=E6TYT3_EVAC2|nr:YisL family protein [Evansella cellulosilytica]ADU31268.1 protein of unknown function DUF1516 [Evansella cellulosilytica DSM 2522]